MKKNLILWSAIIAFIFAACGGSSNTPSSTVEAYFNAVKAGKYEKSLKYLAVESESEDGKLTEKEEAQMLALAGKMEESMKEVGGIESFEVLSETIAEDGNTATVEVKLTNGNGDSDDSSMKLKKVNDEWKIDLSIK